MVLSCITESTIDELNYLGKLLEMQGDEDRNKFTAAVTLGEHAGSVKDLINLAQNLDCYWIYPTVRTEADYGYYLIDELDELELPEEAKKYFKYEEYGRDAVLKTGDSLPIKAISTTTATPFHSGTMGGKMTYRKNTR